MAVDGGRTEGMPVERIGDLVAQAVAGPRPRLRYAVPSSRARAFLMRFMSLRAVNRLMAKRLGLTSAR
jgi:hypothetical protein